LGLVLVLEDAVLLNGEEELAELVDTELRHIVGVLVPLGGFRQLFELGLLGQHLLLLGVLLGFGLGVQLALFLRLLLLGLLLSQPLLLLGVFALLDELCRVEVLHIVCQRGVRLRNRRCESAEGGRAHTAFGELGFLVDF